MQVVLNRDLDRYQREALTDFLQGTQGYAPASGEIVRARAIHCAKKMNLHRKT